MNKHFVSVKIDAEKGEGVSLAERYRALGFPTLLVLDASGEELERLMGFRRPEVLRAELEPILRGESFGALTKRVAANADDFEAKVLLARKHRDRNELEEARSLLESVVASEGASARVREDAAGGLAMVKFLDSGGEDIEGVRAFFDKHRETARATQQALALYMHYGQTEDTEKLLVVAEYLLVHERGRDPQFLNNYAWYLATHDARLDRALELATRAQSIVPVDSNVIDTVAECHARRGDFARAVELAELALKYASEESRVQFETRVHEFRQRAKPRDDAGEEDAGEEDAEETR